MKKIYSLFFLLFISTISLHSQTFKGISVKNSKVYISPFQTVSSIDGVKVMEGASLINEGILSIEGDLENESSPDSVYNGLISILNLNGGPDNKVRVSRVTEFSNINVNSYGIIDSTGTKNVRGTIQINRDATLYGEAGIRINTFGHVNNLGSFTLGTNEEGLVSQAIVDGTIDGDLTVERYIGFEGFHYLSSPLDLNFSSLIEKGKGAELIPNLSAASYNAGEAKYDFINLDTEKLVPGRGYRFFIGDRDSRTSFLKPTKIYPFKGSLNNRAYEIDLGTATALPTSTDYPINLPDANKTGWNLLGSPYPSYMKWSEIRKTSKFANAAIYTLDRYGIVSTYVEGLSTNGGSDFIPPFNAFYVRTSAPDKLTFQLEDRMFGPVDPTKLPTVDNDFIPAFEPDNIIKIKCLNTYNFVEDETIVAFREDATASFDTDVDGLKIINSSFNSHNIYSTDNTNDHYFSINLQPRNRDLNAEQFVIPVGFLSAFNNVVYNISAELINTSPEWRIELEDLRTGEVYDLRNNIPYEFVYTLDTDGHRFNLLINSPRTVSLDDIINSVFVWANANSGINVTIDAIAAQTSETEYRTEIFSLSGNLLYTSEQNISENVLYRPAQTLSRTVYLVRVSIGTFSRTYKVIW